MEQDIWTFVELLRHRISWGYVYYYSFIQKKPEKDKEIAEYYRSNLKKYQKVYRRRVLGLRTYFYMRYHNQGIVLATEGRPDPSLKHIEQFLKDIRKEPLTIKVSDITTLKIYAQKIKNRRTYKVLVLLSKETLSIIKENLISVLKKHANPPKSKQKQAKQAIKKAWLINGYPSFNGLLEQKKILKSWLLKQARIRGINLKQEDLRLSYFRKNRLKG